ATGIGNSVPAIFGLLYFAFNKKGTLYFGKLVWNRKVLLQSIGNGMSELISQLSTAITTLLFNIILLDLMGKAGVASISVILYIQLIQTSIYFGYSVGVAPIISYKYGARDIVQLKKVIKISFVFLSVVSLCTIASSLLFDDMAVSIFIHKSSSTFTMAKDGFRIFSIGYLFMGINVFASAMFTALSNGKVSALLSIVRTLVFLVASLVTLPAMIGLNGVWLAVPVAELLAFVVSIYYYKQGKKVYFY
ncbi:MAG: MATE family efflux transporter, partial [Pygmaiobacter sp.]